MQSLSLLKLACIVVNAVALAAFVYLSLQVHRSKPRELAWRGFVKLVSLGDVPAALSHIYRRWLASFAFFFALTCITVAVFAWSTDHSFFVVLFPLLFYYFFARYLLWEKQDLAD